MKDLSSLMKQAQAMQEKLGDGPGGARRSWCSMGRPATAWSR